MRSHFIQPGRWLALASAFVLLSAGSASAQDANARLDRLERDIQTLSRSVYKGEKPSGALPGSGYVDPNQGMVDDRLNRLEQDLRDLTGRVEEQGFLVNQLRFRLDQMSASTTPVPAPVPMAPVNPAPAPVAVTAPVPAPSRVMTDPNAPAPATSNTVEPLGTVTPDPTNTATSDDPIAAYESAMTLLKARDYAAAETALTDFMRLYPNHNLTQNARYWLGEGYFAQSKYEQAARIFAEGYQQAPRGPKAADNLLKMGLSLAALNKNADACVALQQIGKDFPKGAGATGTRAAAEIKRLKCNG